MDRVDNKVYHGLEQLNLDYISVNTQSHLGVYPAKPGETDVRHNKLNDNSKRFPNGHYHGNKFETFLFQSKLSPQQSTPLPTHGRHQAIGKARRYWHLERKDWQPMPEPRWYHAPCGVKHLDRLWFEQGKENAEDAFPTRSSDLLTGAGYRTGSGLRFMRHVNLYVQEILLPRVLATYPGEYEHCYRGSFRVAALDEDEEARPGFHTGHVIVQNQPIHQHMDGGDSGFCTTFCTGSFEGGYAVFPDFGLVFHYRPGDVLMFRSKALYHGVTTWVPKGDINRLGVMPGRTAHVLYTKASSVDFTKGMGSGWAHLTNVGRELKPRHRNHVPNEFAVEKDGIFTKVRRAGLDRKKETIKGTRVYFA
jgi:hypothetical protein